MLRVLACAAVVGMLWTTTAARVAGAATLPLAAVVPGAVLVQPFGCTALALEPFDPYCPTRHFHSGVDLAAAEGARVYAAAAGLAQVGYETQGCGLFIAVAVDGQVRMLYCHLRHADVSGGPVTTGEPIAEVGSTGLATGPHLHFEVQVDRRSVDPASWLSGGVLTGRVGARAGAP